MVLGVKSASFAKNTDSNCESMWAKLTDFKYINSMTLKKKDPMSCVLAVNQFRQRPILTPIFLILG